MNTENSLSVGDSEFLQYFILPCSLSLHIYQFSLYTLYIERIRNGHSFVHIWKSSFNICGEFVQRLP